MHSRTVENEEENALETFIERGKSYGMYSIEEERQLIVKELEKQSITQIQFDKLYNDIYDFVDKATQKAKEQGKPCLFIIGEMHSSGYARSAVITEVMFLYIAKKFGIKNFFAEENEDRIRFAKNVIKSLHSKPKKLSEKEYLATCNLLPPMGYLLNQTISRSFRLIYTEPETNSENFMQLDRREQRVCDIIKSYKGSAIYTVGFGHLKSIATNRALKDKFLVYAINALNPEILAKIEFRVQELLDSRDYIINSKEVKNFYLTGLLNINIHEALNMAKAAGNTADYSAVLPKNNIDIQYQPEFSNLKKLPDNTFKAQALLSDGLPASSIRHPLEHVTVYALVQAGFFFLLHKAGKCSQPVYNTATVVYKDLFLKNFAEAQQQEAAAEQKLNQSGSSLEAALCYFFGNKYIDECDHVKMQQRRFLVSIINGEFSSEIQNKLSKLGLIKNDAERIEKTRQLMESVQPYHNVDLSFAYHSS